MPRQIGRLLDKLNGLSVAPSTLVVFHSDHGWALGEHGQWQKFNNWEVGARVPLIIRAPWLGRSSSGKRTGTLAELVDIFPTMCDLAGIAIPGTTRGAHAATTAMHTAQKLDGASLGWVMRPGANTMAKAKGKAGVVTEYPRCPLGTVSSSHPSNDPAAQHIRHEWGPVSRL